MKLNILLLGRCDYVTPETFARYEKEAYDLGFKFVASGPLVRSLYNVTK